MGPIILAQHRTTHGAGRPSCQSAFDVLPTASGRRRYPLNNEFSLQLSNCADDHDDGSTERADGIDILAKADEFDVLVVEFVQSLQQTLHRSRHAIDRPDDHDV